MYTNLETHPVTQHTHTHTQREGERKRGRETETETERNRDRDRDRDIETGRQTERRTDTGSKGFKSASMKMLNKQYGANAHYIAMANS